MEAKFPKVHGNPLLHSEGIDPKLHEAVFRKKKRKK